MFLSSETGPVSRSVFRDYGKWGSLTWIVVEHVYSELCQQQGEHGAHTPYTQHPDLHEASVNKTRVNWANPPSIEPTFLTSISSLAIFKISYRHKLPVYFRM